MAVKKTTSREFWTKLGKNVRNLYKDYIFEKGNSVYGKKWWDGKYSTNPSKWVTMSVKKQFKKSAPDQGYSYSEAKKGNMFPRQSTAYKDKVTAVLTTQTQSDFEGFMKPRENGVQLGYPSMGDRVKKLRKQKGKSGALTSSDRPLPTHLSKYIAKKYHEFIKKNSKDTTRVHKGKRK